MSGLRMHAAKALRNVLTPQQISCTLFILDKGKPVVRRGRKAMGPVANCRRIARLPKG
jgi:hypothetical protein